MSVVIRKPYHAGNAKTIISYYDKDGRPTEADKAIKRVTIDYNEQRKVVNTFVELYLFGIPVK